MSTQNLSASQRGGVIKTFDEILVVTKRQLLQIPRVPELLVFSTIQPIMFVLLFAFVFGSAIPLAAALDEAWQFGLLAAAAVALLVGRLGIVTTLVACGVIGGIGAIAGAPIPH